MANMTTHQLLLLADHVKLSLLERQRAISLNLEPEKCDAQIIRSLVQLRDGLEAVESRQNKSQDVDAEVARIRRQYSTLSSQFHSSAPLTAEATKPNDASLTADFAAAQSRPARNRSVRFRDDPSAEEEDATAHANRTALFADQERYRDEPEPRPDQLQMDNQQIHAYHQQVLHDQDEQLDALGESIGRQRMMGIQMGNELDEQVELLDDMERGVDRHSNTLDRAKRRLMNVARKSRENWSWITISILIIILILVVVILK